MTDEQKTVIETVRNELGYRREKQWKIFSWTATLLLAAIAGVVTLVGKKEFLFPMWPQRAAMAAALVVISFYACSWIRENIAFEFRSRSRLLELLREAGLTEHVIPDPKRAPKFGYSATIILLAIGAAGTVLFASPEGCTFFR